MNSEAVIRIETGISVARETLDLRGRIERNPYGMVAGAIGIGFVLGGGLFTRIAARGCGVVLRIGLMAALPILQEKIVQAIVGTKSEIDGDIKKGE